MTELIEMLRAVEVKIKAEQAAVGRGPGGQELAVAATHVRTARLFLLDAQQAPVTTAFTTPEKA
jgi:hypothetical protein